MDLKLNGLVALVTGASIGLGHSIARMLADEGARVAILARRTSLLNELADEIEKSGKERPFIITEDITADGAAERIRDQVQKHYGRCDILVNNAGGSRPMPGLGTEPEWAEAMLLNFTSGRRLTHALIPLMQANKYGRIINVTGGDEPLIMNAAMPPNGAVHIWSKALSRLVAKDGITVNSIPPGRIHSEQIDKRIMPTEESRRAWVEGHCPAGYIGQPEDLAVLCVWLASPLARYITGQVIHVDGGARRFAH
ncbi:MAG: SDR family oxidoreductase [Alphaproteobacteria bacterium]|nr:SDR family oxidoreductase [Alphaproteobacteria bacterium]